MSEVKVNKISPRSGTGVQLGDSGDTITIPAGATINNQGTATNFGATGSASWVTTVKTSSPFTAVAGEGYFINTTGGAVTVNLPAGTAGAVVAIKDYAGTFDTNKVTLVQNGSDKIGGSAINASLTTEGIAVTLVFIDSTQGWLVTDSGLQTEAPTAAFIVATGGTIATSPCGNFKTHIFTGPGTFTVCSVGNPAGSNTVDYLVVAGGGSGGRRVPGNGNGGGGAGGFRGSSSTFCSPGVSGPGGPLLDCVSALTVSAQGYPIVVGAGGAQVPGPGSPGTQGNNGNVSTFDSITSAGGGGGGHGSAIAPGSPGGSGGGGGGGSSSVVPAGVGNTPPTNPAQGTSGGTGGQTSPDQGAAGGGGAMVAGSPAPSVPGNGPGGAGAGIPTAFGNIGAPGPGSFIYYSGGGGAGISPDYPNQPTGGIGGGGQGGAAGIANTGGGGGGANGPGSPSGNSGAGGSGLVVIRYKFQ